MPRIFVILAIFAIVTGAVKMTDMDKNITTTENPNPENSGHNFWLSNGQTGTRSRLGAIWETSSKFIFHLLKHKFKYPFLDKVPATEPISNCICVPYYQCDANNTIITDGMGDIDIRFFVNFRRCTGDLEVCCRFRLAPIVTPTLPTTTTTTPRPTTRTTTTTTPRPTTTTTPRPTIQPTTTTTPRPTTRPTTTTTPRPTTPTTLPTLPPIKDCICVPYAQCDSTGFIIVGGEGIINPRQTANPCTVAGEICCRIPSTPTVPVITFAPSPVTIPSPVTCACVQIYLCDSNGYIVVSGAGVIDPRFPIGRQGQIAGTCLSTTEICCKIPPNGIDSSIGIPVYNPASGTIMYAGTAQACRCVKTWQCTSGNVVTVDGSGVIDPRFGACPVADEICCRVQGITRNLGSVPSVVGSGGNNVLIINPNPPGTSAVCGKIGSTCLFPQACATNPGETSFAEFPWMVALLIRRPDGTSVFQCGASMINTRSILTAAHCVTNRQAGSLVARFGEWNTANENEPAPFQEAAVQAVITHPQYYNAGLYNDVAVLILASPVTYAVNVMPICLPQQGQAFTPGVRCYATGWGRSGFEGKYQTILRKIDLPIVDRGDCQSRLRTTKLGQYFQLHGSFMCAGGEASKDTCRGDGGGPLVCVTATGQYVQTGIVSWGIGCGESNVPAVYTSVSLYRQWIDQQLANYGIS